MKKAVSIFLITGLVFGLVGCASSSASKRQKPNDQMALMTNELARMDAMLRETNEALRIQQERNQELEERLQEARVQSKSESSGPSGQGMYRTPSGFELPSRDIQSALKNAGFYKGEVDGKIGPGTRTAIREFQEVNGLKGDGICGKGTWEKLKKYLEK